MGEALKHQVTETIKHTYILELRNKYTGFMAVKTIDLVHHLVDRYGEMIEKDLKENQKIFDEELDTTIPIDKYVEIIDDWI